MEEPVKPIEEPVQSTEEHANNKSDIKSLIAVSIPWLIVCGFAELSIYYMRFDINILSYFNISDVFPSLLPELVILVLVVIFNSVLLFFMPRVYTVDNGYDVVIAGDAQEPVEEDAPHKFVIWLRANAFKHIILIDHFNYGFAAVFTLLLYTLFLSFNYNDLRKIGWILLLLAIVVITLTYIYNVISKKLSGKLTGIILSKELNFINKCFITLFITSCFIGYLRANLTESNYYKGTSILINQKIKSSDTSYYVVSDTTNYYIGKTSSYIIFYNSAKEIATFFPISDVKEIKLHVRKDPFLPNGVDFPDPLPLDHIPHDPVPPDPTHPRRSVPPNK